MEGVHTLEAQDRDNTTRLTAMISHPTGRPAGNARLDAPPCRQFAARFWASHDYAAHDRSSKQGAYTFCR
jgi:hypothetical protein